MTQPVACSRCGRRAAGTELRRTPGSGGSEASAAAVAAGWLHEPGIGGGADSWMCQACLRRHIRSIEARLDEAWW